ncbi:hypothetical protein [Actinomadura rugatobispora]|uniref:C2H2-type domain-containing protein n=1 Tax=Actinomadura rugatobispora TaxID=1994 RepID=A0ABW0ZL75_9ACTN|nr:hypothetical protein GCM10010200_060320 [Actinomadura rugatobispora]
MRDAWSSHETWVFECVNCATTWEEEFDVRHCADGHGGEVELFEHDGQRCTTPWIDHVCPGCAGQNVKARPASWRRRTTAVRAPARDDLELVFRLRRLHAY